MAQVPRFIPENGIFSPGGLASQYKVPGATNAAVCKGQLAGWKKPRLCKPPSLLPSTVYDRSSSSGEGYHSEGSRDLSRPSFLGMDEQFLVEDRVFNIDILLVQILESLPPSDLKTCRLVNHHWNDTATKLLQNSQSLQVSSYFQRNDSHREYSVRVRHSKSSRSDYDLEELTELMSNSWNFPCNSFRFFDGNLVTPALQIFFDRHGPLVKNLLLDIYFCRGDPIRQVLCDFPRMGALEKLLSEQITKLETLSLINFPDIGYLESASLFTPGSGTTLPYLKYLELEDDEYLPFQVYVDIIEAASNLQHITIESHRHIQYLLDTNRTCLIYGLTFRFSEEYLRLYNQLLRTGELQLQKLVLRLGNLRGQESFWGILSGTLFQILSKNASTLKAIQWQPLGVLSGFGALPPLAGVTHIGIADVPGDYVSVFPTDFSVSKVFPNLLSVSIELTALTRPAEENGDLVQVDEQAHVPHFDDYFSIAPITTVTSLSISSCESLPLTWFTNLPFIFPNARTGKFSGISSKACLQSLWNFKSLHTVQVKLEVCSDDQFGPHGIDAALTGLDAQDCEQMISQNCAQNGYADFEGESLSLANLPDLKSLWITIEDKQPYFVHEPLPTLLSSVTKCWIRCRLPKLQIQLELVTEELANTERLEMATIRPYTSSY